MIDNIKEKFQRLLSEKDHKEIMFMAILYLGIVYFTFMSIVTIILGYNSYFFIKFSVLIIMLGILYFYKKTSKLKLSIIVLTIIINIEISIAILSDEMFILPTLYPFIAIAGYFFFFNFKEAVLLTIFHYLFWIIVFYLGYHIMHPAHPFFRGILNIFVTSFFILTFSISYHFSTTYTYEKIEKTLNENDTIIKEIYHRITNNLNFMAAILGLQINHSKKVPHESYQECLKKSRLKIDTIAILHGVLYETKNFEHIEFGQYIKNLTNLITKTYARKIKTRIETNQMKLDISTTNRLGIIINELLTNSIKHSFGDEILHISISLKKEQDNYHFAYHEVAGKEMDLTKLLNSKNIGMRLIRMIAEEQIEGELEIGWEDGLLVEIVFS